MVQRNVLLLAAMILAVLLAGGLGREEPAVAQTPEPLDARPSSDRESATAVQPRSPEASRLLQRAEREGDIRVIVGLRTGFVPEGRLDRSRAAGQRSGIDSARSAVRADLAGTGYRTVREYETVPYVALELTPEAFRAAQSSPDVTSITEDVAVPADVAESTTIVQAPTYWANNITGAASRATVAVLDTGVDRDHNFLNPRVVEEACYTSNRVAGSGNCPNGTSTQLGAGAGVPCTYAARGCEHGTHVAGIAAGNGSSFSGVAKGASIMSVQVFSRFTGTACNNAGEDPCALSFTSDQIAGLERVFALRGTHNIAAVNMSLGGGQFASYCDTDPRKAIIDNLWAASIPTVISSGNGGFTNAVGAPACISTAVTVGATTKQDTIYELSNASPMVDLLAPGVGINSSVPGGGFAVKSGTSMAAPHVAGAWALIFDAMPELGTGPLSTMRQRGTPVRDTRPGGTVTSPRINTADTLGIRPPNDRFGSPQTLRSGGIMADGINGAATREPDEPDHLPASAGSLGENSVWFSWTAPFSGAMYIDTCTSSFDTVLAVYTGSSVGALTQVASNDDGCVGGGSFQIFSVTAGTTYRIAVSGYSANSEGAFTLDLRYARPSNDNFVGNQTVSGTSVLTDGKNLGATRENESGEPDHLPTAGSLGERSVWYGWMAPSSGRVTLDTCTSNFDTVLAVYTGSSVGALTRIASDDNACDTPNSAGSRVTFDATAGAIYRFAVAGFGTSDEGTFTLNLAQADNVAPTVKSTNPKKNATGVSPTANITATFSKAMDAGTISTATVKLKKDGATTNVPAAVTYNPTTKKATLNPNAALEAGANYTATVTTGARDAAGNALDQSPTKAGNQAKTWRFKVSP